jgi:2-hydroxychromene-2-carboxylate isomerase
MYESIAVYFDYTCPYSFRALGWLEDVQRSGRQLTVTWRTLSLKEVNRRAGEASFLSGTPGDSVSILALELAKATQAMGPDVFEG